MVGAETNTMRLMSEKNPQEIFLPIFVRPWESPYWRVVVLAGTWMLMVIRIYSPTRGNAGSRKWLNRNGGAFRPES